MNKIELIEKEIERNLSKSFFFNKKDLLFMLNYKYSGEPKIEFSEEEVDEGIISFMKKIWNKLNN